MGLFDWWRTPKRPNAPQPSLTASAAAPAAAAVPPAASAIPDGWTDDMTIPLAPPHTLEQVVEVVLQAGLRREHSDHTAAHLIATFGLLPDDADLAIDRTMGGVVRAATGNPANCPRREKDPVAWLSYQRCLREPALIPALQPVWFPSTR